MTGMSTYSARTALFVLLALELSASAAADTLNWEFDVLLDDKEIGYHTFSVANDGSTAIMESEAEFDVKFLFITAFRYRHENTEVWSDGCLSSIDAMTIRNGDLLEVKGEQGADSFAVSGQNGTATLEDCVQTFAYWNPAILDSERLLNSQTGEYEDITVSFEDRDEVVVGERPVAALRYRLSAKAGDITLWYSSDDRRWLALEAPAKGGRTIRYQPTLIPQINDGENLQARRN